MWVPVTSDPRLLIPNSILAHAVVKLAWSWATVKAAGAGKNYVNTCVLSRMGLGKPIPPFTCESFSGLLDWPFQTPRP